MVRNEYNVKRYFSTLAHSRGFYAILSTKDRLDGVPVTNNEIKDFGE